MAQDRDQEHTTGCKQPEAPRLCANNCGFFGCPATMNLCSKCYRDLRLEEESRVSAKAFGEKSPVTLTGINEKTVSKGVLSACLPTTEGLQGDVIVSSQLSSTERLPERKAGTPSTSCVDTSKPPQTSEGTFKTELEPVISVSQSTPEVAHRVQSRGATRCVSCRKRVGLLGFKCRCGGFFCVAHRYSGEHGCSFDYKAAGRDAIAKANPVVKAEKVEKI